MSLVYFGTMGWSYPDWRGPFYALGTPDTRLLAEYATVFDAIELDTTFYAPPKETTLAQWDRQTPAGFKFSAKIPKLVTHERRLVGPASVKEARDFATLMQDNLGQKLGRLVLQLPPDFGPGEARNLLTFADGLAEYAFPLTVELRESGWQQSEIASLLAERGMQLATTDRVAVPGAPLTYLRLLGEENSVEHFDQRVLLKDTELDHWAEQLRAASGVVFVHVRNYYEGHAPATLFELRKHLGLALPTPPGQQQMSLF
ncbi:DUF72 domain-containing protein [Armatimonas sp.]|uniref:DUF72 domain-containing protein n=1 Tax=Armatimonas sp. TaxID=1872638 RepID=UPI00286B594B|nr:DUF72 domain-containing protein [Armatimonas sp.]